MTPVRAESPIAKLAADVRRLFELMDRRDLEGFLASFTPQAQIVHDDGRSTSPRTLARALSASEPPIRRRLHAFGGDSNARLAWIAYENHVTFRRDGGVRRHRFSETALLRKDSEGWRFVRIHYSGERRG
jgi:hypothetical protein